MTRITHFGIKRTYVQAGFSDDNTTTEMGGGGEGERPQKKRERVGKRKAKNAASSAQPESRMRSRDARPVRRAATTEQRRIKRERERKADTTCFVCREKGHAAQDCRTGRSVVGVCYRCGSTRHNLSRCKEPVDEFDRLPFASCFVCRNKGHLASTCPHNKDKGVYPNGGSCRLCGETSHLARDCALRKQDSAKASLHLGTGRDAGADEDDFHVLKRRHRDVALEAGDRRVAKVVHF